MLIIFLFAFLAAASAVPYVSLPFNSQYPPVGRAGQVYSYELSPHTFGPLPDAADFQLALDNGPSWLSLNSTSLVLEGKPAEEDVGSSSFSIVASKGANQVTMNCSLRVVDYRGPDVKGDLVDVMVEGNDRTGSTTVLIAPDSAVLVELADDTFGSEWNNLSYAATNDDGLPLPSWLNFNPDNLTFSGQAPRLENASQLFDIRVVASDMDGFASAELPFTFVLSEHKLAFSPVSPNITLKTGDAVHFDSIGSMLQLDGKQVEVDQTSSLSAHGLPDWLEYDSKTGSLDGNSPDGVESLAFSVEASDKYDGYVNTTFTLTFVPSLFTGAIQTLDATPGTAFSYTFPDSLFAAQGLNIALQTTRTTAWLAYSPANKIMYGDVPLDMATGDIEVTLVATSPQHPSTTERRIIKIHLTQAKTKDAMLHKKRIIMVICLMSVLAITILIGMRVLYIRARRRRRSRKTDPKTISHGNHPSNPYTIGTDPDTDDDDDDPEQGSAVEKSEKQHAPSNPSPPCLELSEAPPTKSHAQQPKPTNPSSTPLTPFGRDTLFVLTEAYGRLSARDGICATERAIKRAASSPESHKNDNNNNDKISKAKPKPKPRKSSSSPPSRTPSSIKRKGEVAAAALRRKWSNASGVSRSSYSSSALSAKLSEFPTPPLPSLPSLPSLVTAGSVGMGRDGVVSRVDRVVAEGEMANSTTTKQKQKQNQKRPRPTSTLSMFPPPSSSTPKTGLKVNPTCPVHGTLRPGSTPHPSSTLHRRSPKTKLLSLRRFLSPTSRSTPIIKSTSKYRSRSRSALRTQDHTPNQTQKRKQKENQKEQHGKTKHTPCSAHTQTPTTLPCTIHTPHATATNETTVPTTTTATTVPTNIATITTTTTTTPKDLPKPTQTHPRISTIGPGLRFIDSPSSSRSASQSTPLPILSTQSQTQPPTSHSPHTPLNAARLSSAWSTIDSKQQGEGGGMDGAQVEQGKEMEMESLGGGLGFCVHVTAPVPASPVAGTEGWRVGDEWRRNGGIEG